MEEYIENLKVVGSLSKLFSDSSKPYLYYRVAEKLYNQAFGATDVSRNDIAIDSKYKKKGVGLKTFVGHNGKKSYQKVAEFNALKVELDNILANRGQKEYIKAISNYRNNRISYALDTFDLNGAIYHSVVRDVGKFKIIEEPMHLIQVDDIQNIKGDKIINFDDGLEAYKYNVSKSTLFKQFNESSVLEVFDVKIVDSPLETLKKLTQKLKIDNTVSEQASVILPLYSTRTGKVPERSGLNQWNAEGRPRNLFEIYISVPAFIHKKFPDFFPARDTKFSLLLPNKKVVSAKICQDNGKALMSDPNAELGEWLFRKGLNFQPGKLVSREMLNRVGIDSVEITKKDSNEYELSLRKLGSFDEFVGMNS